MIERKDVKHELRQQEHIHLDEVHSTLFFSISKFIDEAEQRQARYEIIPEAQQRNEEAIRRKLYGDVVDELKIMQDFAERCEQSVEQLILVGRFYDLIDKLEWRDTDGTR